MGSDRMIIGIPLKLKNMIRNCNSLNNCKCEYCPKNKTCKEYQITEKLKQIEKELNGDE